MEKEFSTFPGGRTAFRHPRVQKHTGRSRGSVLRPPSAVPSGPAAEVFRASVPRTAFRRPRPLQNARVDGEPSASMEAEARLRDALNARIRLSRRSLRSLEKEIGLGHGTLSNMLRGRSELRVRHLELVGRALGVTVPELVAEAYGLGPEARRRGRDARLRSLVAEVVRTELAAF